MCPDFVPGIAIITDYGATIGQQPTTTRSVLYRSSYPTYSSLLKRSTSAPPLASILVLLLYCMSPPQIAAPYPPAPPLLTIFDDVAVVPLSESINRTGKLLPISWNVISVLCYARARTTPLPTQHMWGWQGRNHIRQCNNLKYVTIFK